MVKDYPTKNEYICLEDNKNMASQKTSIQLLHWYHTFKTQRSIEFGWYMCHHSVCVYFSHVPVLLKQFTSLYSLIKKNYIKGKSICKTHNQYFRNMMRTSTRRSYIMSATCTYNITNDEVGHKFTNGIRHTMNDVHIRLLP